MSEASVYELKDKVVIVTGSGSGIGEATAIQFAKYGSRVVINCRNVENAQRVSTVCDQSSPFNYKSLIHTGDLMDDKVCDELIEKTVKHFNRIDVLVNNAGTPLMSSILDDDFFRHYDLLMNINTRVPLRLSKLALPHLIESKGCIVNLNSLYSFTGCPYATHYGMSKAALDAMTKHLAVEFGPKGVRVVSVAPGSTLTNMHKTLNLPVSMWEELGESCPLKRAAQPSEIANAICFAASSAASFITGSNIIVDGGHLLNH